MGKLKKRNRFKKKKKTTILYNKNKYLIKVNK